MAHTDWKNRCFGKCRRTTASVALLLLLAGALDARADNWPRFRGPDGAGISTESGLPATWDGECNVAWKTPVAGIGWSSPIVWEDRVWVTTAVSQTEQERPRKGLYLDGNRSTPHDSVYEWKVLCLDAKTGKVLWEQTAHRGKPAHPIHLKNSYASETPATDGEHVFAFFGGVGIYCYDRDGKLVWEQPIAPLPMNADWGTGSSPVVDDQHVYLQCDNESDSYLLALDKRTGKQAWRVDRDEPSSWSTPLLWRRGETVELVTAATNYIRGNSPQNGELLWQLGGMSTSVSPAPIPGPEMVFVTSGNVTERLRPIYAIRGGQRGDLSLPAGQSQSDAVAWSYDRGGPYMTTPLYLDGILYVLDYRGILTAYDGASGEPVFAKKRIGGGAYTASPWSYDGKLFCLNEDGETIVVEAGREGRVLGKNPIGEMCMATPAVANGAVFLRTVDHLYCIREAEHK